MLSASIKSQSCLHVPFFDVRKQADLLEWWPLHARQAHVDVGHQPVAGDGVIACCPARAQARLMGGG